MPSATDASACSPSSASGLHATCGRSIQPLEPTPVVRLLDHVWQEERERTPWREKLPARQRSRHPREDFCSSLSDPPLTAMSIAPGGPPPYFRRAQSAPLVSSASDSSLSRIFRALTVPCAGLPDSPSMMRRHLSTWLERRVAEDGPLAAKWRRRRGSR